MKIISKYKDYYDHLQGKYGIDEKIIFKRGDSSGVMLRPNTEFIYGGVINPYEVPAEYIFAICGIIHVVYFYEDKFYYGHDIKKILKEGRYNRKNNQHYLFKGREFRVYVLKYHGESTTINDQQNTPVCLVNEIRNGKDDFEFITSNFKLEDFGFAKIIPAHDMYINISNWLSREKPVIDNRTDIQKIVGKGFDKKTSFRKMKRT